MPNSDDYGPRKDYDGPKRRYGEADHKGNGVKIHGPHWFGGLLEISGPNVIAVMAIVVLALAASAIVYFGYQADLRQAQAIEAQTKAMQNMAKVLSADHLRMTQTLLLQADIADETQCILTLMDERSRREARKAPGGACAFIGVKRSGVKEREHVIMQDHDATNTDR